MNRKAMIPAFGDWDYYCYNYNTTADGFPITQYFDTHLLNHYQYNGAGVGVGVGDCEQHDLYDVGADLCQNEDHLYHNQQDYLQLNNKLLVPTTVVPSFPTKKSNGVKQHYQDVGKQHKNEEGWVYDPVKESPPKHKKPQYFQPTKKVIDEDLYKISPKLLQRKAQKKKIFRLFTRCLEPICAP